MNKKRVLSIVLALAVVVNLFITNPISKKKVLAEDPDPSKLDVTKTIDWDPANPTNAKITITSNVPDVNDTEVLFLGTLCSKHGMGGINDPTGNVIVQSINAIANNANVDYWLLDADIDGSGAEDHKPTSYTYNLNDTQYEHQGRVLRGESMNVTTNKGVRIVNGSNHTAIYGFAKLLIQELQTNGKEYDYIVLEFDASRIARFSRLMFPNNYDVFGNVFTPLATLLEPYYKENKVIWITDGFDPDYSTTNFDDKYGKQPYTPTNFYYYNGDKNYATLSAKEFKALCSLVAPSYYLQYKDVDPDSYTYPATNGVFGPKNQAEIMQQGDPKNSEFSLGSSYSLKPGTLVTDYIYGEPTEYKAYSSDSRQLYYNNAEDLSKFLYMAIQGATLKFDDKIHMADDITIENVKVSVSKKANPTSDSDWIQKDYLDVSTATLQTDPVTGEKYVMNSQSSDVADEIKVYMGNNDPKIDNQIKLSVKDLKNQLTYVKVEINVTDNNGFKSCIKLKNDGKTPPTILNKDGNPWQPGDEYVYEMNPNDGLANVDAYKNGNTTGSGDAHGESPAKAPALDIYHVTSTVEGGAQDFDESKQDGRIFSSDTAKSEIVVSTYEKDSPYLTYKPNAGYEFESVTIDENTVIGPSDFDQEGKASGTITKGKYEITFDSETGAVKVAIPGIVADRVVKVKYTAPKIEITKTVVSPTSGVVAKAGDVVEFKITVKNTGTVIAKDFTISDTIDTEKVTYKESDNSGSYNTTTHTVSWDIESLAAGASKDLSLKVTVLIDLEGEKNLINVAGGQFNRTTPTPIPNCTPAEQPLKGRDVSVVYHVSGDIPSSYTTPSSLTKTYGTTLTNDEITAMTVPTIDGYEFTEWKLNEDFSGSSFDTSKNLNDTNFTSLQNGGSQIDLYGKWKIIKDFDIEKSVTLADGTAITGDVAPGTTVLYSIKVTNKNQYVDIEDVVVSDTVPTGLTISDASDTPSIDGQKITWTVDIGKGSSKTLTFKATVPSDLKVRTKYDNVATINSADGDSINKNSNTSTFYAGPENITLTVEKAWSDTWNSHASETLKVRLYRKLKTESDDKFTAVTDVNIIELTSSNPSQTVSVPQYDEDGNEYDYIFREITVNASAGTETKYEAGDMYGDYEVSYDTTTARKTKISNDYIVKVTDLEIDKTVSATIAAPGDTITYTITVKNTRKYESATGIKVTDVLPTGVTIASTNGLNADIGTASNSGNNVTWEISSLAGDTTATLTIKVVVGSNLNATQLLNVASIVEFDGTTYDDDDYPSPKVKTDVRTFKVTKVWSNPTASHDAVTVILLQNGVQYTTNGQVSLDSSNSWTYTWTNLPLNDEEGKPYTYTVKEVEVEGYDTTITYSPTTTTTKAYEYTSATIKNVLKTYDVKYNIVGSVDPGVAKPSNETLDWGTNYNAKDKLSAEGYEFSGWYTDADCKVPYVDGMTLNDTNVPSGTLNLYGSWKTVKDFSITKAVTLEDGTAITGDVAPGTTVLYSIKVTNNNKKVDIPNVVITDAAPTGLAISDISDSGTKNGQTITWTVTVPKGETKTLTFKATVPSDLKVRTKYDNLATIDSADGVKVDKSSELVTFYAVPDNITLVVSKDWSDGWTNHSSETVKVRLYKKIASEVNYTPVDPIIELTAANPSKTVSVPPYDKDGNAYDYIFREVIVDASAGTETKLEDGDMNGKYKVSYDTTTTAGTTKISNDYVVTAADLEFNKVASSQTIEPGGTLTYTITVKNTRTYPKEIAKDIKITDTLPTGVTLLTTGGLSADKGTATNSGNDITWEIAELGPGVTATLTIKVTVSSDLKATRLKNTAKITEVGGKEDPKQSPTVPTDVRTFKVTKAWSNSSATHNAVTVKLLQNGNAYTTNGQVSLDSSNSWTYTWTNLPMYDKDGKLYVYKVDEVAVDGYKTEITYTDKDLGNTAALVTNTLKTYDVKYNIVGKENPGVAVPDTETLDWGTAYNAEEPLKADGYVFSGWYTDADCKVPYVDGMILNDTNVPSGTFNLYGSWKSVKDFAITKAVSYQGASISEPVAPGSTVLYTITVKNKNANAPIKNVVISDVVPDGLTISNVSDSGKVTGQTIEWTLDMAKDETKTLTFNATVPADLKVEKKYDNVATVVSADGEPVGVKSPTSTFKAKPADIVLSVAKDWSDKWTSHDTETVYVQLSRKIASETSYTPVEVVELTAAEPAKSLKMPPYDKEGNLYEYIFRELTAQSGTELADGEMNGKYKVSYDTTTTAGTTNILNTYIIDANDLEFNKTTDSDLSEPGEVFTYTITVKNTRDYETATNVVVTDTLPEGVTLVTPDGLVFTSPDTAVDDGKANITWTIPTIAPGTTATLVIKVTVNDGVDASRLTNIAQIKEVGDTSYDPTDFPSPPALTDVRTFTAKKIWSNPTAEHDAVTVVLLQNGQPYAVNPSVELSSTNGWTYTWTKLPMYDASNNYYVYTVEEIAVPGYSTITSYSGGTYGNTSVDIENTLKTYDISYQIVGSVIPSGVTVPSGDTVDWGTMYTAKDKLSKEYYVFSGWFEDSACTTPYVDGTVINDTTAPCGKKVLYGKWERLTTDITFQPGNGKHPDSDQVVYPKDTTEYRGEFFPMPNDAVYGGEDFKFGGWFLDPECTKPYVPGTLTMEKLPLYAKWTYLPTVSYKFIGEVPSDAKLPATERMPEGTAYNADSKTKSTDNYIFDGWYIDSACTKKYTDGTKIYEDTVLYGKWTRKTTNVILLPGAGDGPKPGDVTYPTIPTGKRGDVLPTPPDPTYNGSDYKFGGWFLDPDCTIPYVPGPMNTPEIKLYAKWTTLPVVRYAFVGETPDGVKLPGMDVVQPGTSYRTTSPSGTTALYVFDGWYLDIACTQRYVEGTKIYNDTMVYGRWLPVFPKTGEEASSHTSWAVVLLLSGAGIATFLYIDKKRRSHN